MDELAPFTVDEVMDLIKSAMVTRRDLRETLEYCRQLEIENLRLRLKNKGGEK